LEEYSCCGILKKESGQTKGDLSMQWHTVFYFIAVQILWFTLGAMVADRYLLQLSRVKGFIIGFSISFPLFFGLYHAQQAHAELPVLFLFMLGAFYIPLVLGLWHGYHQYRDNTRDKSEKTMRH